jgi:DNA helicase-2/ATP-dependent DNA helicase PcrA
LGADRLLQDLDDSQRRAVTSPACPLAILAPAGSGKTRVLTRRIAWRVAEGDAESSHVLALTFTRKAAGELRDRLRTLGLRDGVATGTFHSVAYAQLRSRWVEEGRQPPALLTRKGRLLGELLRSGSGSGAGSGSASGSGSGAGLTAAQVAAEIEWAKARLAGPDGYVAAVASARRRVPGPPERVAELYERYEDEKRRRRLVDFDDLLRLCSHHIESDARFAAAQRWRFRHLFVDEFQDVNPLQMQLVEAWRGDRYDLCVVGDPHQAIYGWNGADAGFLERFQTLYPPAEVIALDRNYRSTPQVLSAAADVLRAAQPASERSAAARSAAGAGSGAGGVQAVRPDGPPPRLERYSTDREEAWAVARAVRDRRAPRTPWSAQAVLVRTNAQIPLIAEAFRGAGGIPHRVRGGQGDLLGRQEVRSALDLLRRNDGPLAACMPDLAALAEEAASAVRDDVADDDPGDAEAAANLGLIERFAHDHLRLDPRSSASGFLGWLVATLDAEGDDGASRDAVTIATFHAAKGLEWPIVHLAGVEDGFVPIAHARSQHARAEEARLLYVAMTRAEDELRCTWAAQRAFGGRVVERRLSPWLSGLAAQQKAAAAAPAAAGPPEDWRSRLADQRALLAASVSSSSLASSAALGASGGPQAAAVEALHAWRDEAARAVRVEPEALVDDQLLEAIAAARPASTDELAAVPGMGPLLAARVGEGLLAALDRVPANPAAPAAR